MLKFSKICTTALIFGAAQMTHAQDKITPNSLDEVVVTASKFPQKQAQTGKVLTVISNEILQKSSGKTLSELLNQQVGITIIGSTNPLGTNQDVYIRGASAAYTLILLNGTPINDPSNISNSFDLNLIPIDQIERIEVLKGGQSTLYGSDALAGVINIITKKMIQKSLQGTATAAAGSYGTYKIYGGIGGQISKMNYALQFTNLSSKGFPAATDLTNSQDFKRDGYVGNNLNARIEQQLSERLLLKFLGGYNQYKADIPGGAFVDEKDYTATSQNILYGTGLSYEGKKTKFNFNFTHNATQRIYINDSTYVPKNAFDKYSKGSYLGNSDFAEAYSNFALSNKLDLLVGVENRWQNTQQDYFSVSAYGIYTSPPLQKANTKTTQFSGFTLVSLKDLKFGKNNFGAEVGGRFNNHSVYGSNFTFSLNPYLLLAERLKFFVNYSSSFKSPTEYQLFSPYGTPDLKPEKGLSFESGVQLFSTDKTANLRIVYFKRDVQDIIIFQSISQDPYGKYVNFDSQHDHGIEIEGQWKVGKMMLTANYTFVDGRLSSKVAGKDTTYFNLFRRPKNSFNATMTYQLLPKWSVALSMKALGKRVDNFYDENIFATRLVNLAAYTTFDVYQEYAALKNLKVFLDLKNITNQDYTEIYGYNSRKFNFMAGLTFKF